MHPSSSNTPRPGTSAAETPASGTPAPNSTSQRTSGHSPTRGDVVTQLSMRGARQLRVDELRDRAAALMRVHRPDRAPWTWTRRWAVLRLPWRRGAACTSCHQAWPCPPMLVAERLASASRLLLAQLTVDAFSHLRQKGPR